MASASEQPLVHRQATVAVASTCEVGESPLWDGETGRLLWVDIPAGEIYAHEPLTGNTASTQLDDAVGFVVARRCGGYVSGTATGLVALDADLRVVSELGSPPDLEGRRINDGTCDPAGRVLFGTVVPGRGGTGSLWSLSPDGRFAELATGVQMSNGLAFSPNGRWLYYVDTLTQRVDRFEYDVATGALADRHALCEIPEDVGLPDGLAVDADGGLWLAIWGSGEVWRIAEHGDHRETVAVSAQRPSSCAFGGANWDRLYITTAASGGAEQPSSKDLHAGAVFAADVGVRGGPVWTADL
ncbi:MAG: hypothetical protein V7607_5621 [Solirubrobacteraceae bacterium]